MERIHEVHSIDRQASKRIYVVQDEADKDSNGYQTLWFLLNEICLDTQSQDCGGTDNLKTFYWNLDRKKYRIESVSLFMENKVYSYRYTWMN